MSRTSRENDPKTDHIYLLFKLLSRIILHDNNNNIFYVQLDAVLVYLRKTDKYQLTENTLTAAQCYKIMHRYYNCKLH